MAETVLTLPERLERRLMEEAEKEAATLEELVLKAIEERYGSGEPGSRAELHLRLCEKYIDESERLLGEEEYTQASEKACCAAAQIVKAVAVREGRSLRSHGELHAYVSSITERLKDRELGRLWRSAASLHQNFYEDWLPPEMVRDGIEDAKLLVGKLKRLL